MNNILEQLQQELTRSLSGLDAAQTQLRPIGHPEKWSIQQIVEHLLLTYASTGTALQARLTKGTPTQATPSLQQRVGQFFLITLGVFPRGREAPIPVTPQTPQEPIAGADLTALIAQRLAHLDQTINQFEALFGTQHAATHMVLGPLSARQWRRFQLIHGVHHAKQIIAIRRSHGL